METLTIKTPPTSSVSSATIWAYGRTKAWFASPSTPITSAHTPCGPADSVRRRRFVAFLASDVMLKAAKVQFDFATVHMNDHLCVFDARGGKIVHKGR